MPQHPPFPGTRTCLLCGTTDDHGLQEHMVLEAGVLHIPLVPERRFQGFPGIMHGGFVALFLDEVIGVAVGFGNGGVAVTQQLHLEYHRPVHVGQEIRVEGWMGGVISGHRHWGEGRITHADGTVLVTARGEFAVMAQEVLARIFRVRPRATHRP